MGMLKIAVCDDEKAFSSKLEVILMEIGKQEKIQMDIDVYQGGMELINGIQGESVGYDIIFLDIEMEGMNGLDTAKEIRKQDEIVLLIYVTSHKSYAIEAYEVQPFRFVVKPIHKDIIYQCFMKAFEKITAGNFYFSYKFQKNYYKILVSDILYFESEKRVIWVHLKNGSVQKFYDKLNHIEKQMGNGKVLFYRLHKSFLVNSQYIVKKSYDHVELINGITLDISEDRRKQFNELYIKMMVGEMID